MILSEWPFRFIEPNWYEDPRLQEYTRDEIVVIGLLEISHKRQMNRTRLGGDSVKKLWEHLQSDVEEMVVLYE